MCARLGSVFLFTLLIGSATAPNAVAQGLTGQISGTVVDSSRGVLPGAAVAVQNVNTQVKRDVVSDESGAFVITDLLAGTYNVSVTMSGFKTYQQTDVVLSANERLALRTIVLEVGQLEETIAVTAESARVQTTSGERSGLITQQQLQDISLKGKDYMGMLRLLPGVIDTQNREAPGWNNLGGLSINGGRNSTINLTYDGVTNLDTGSNTGPFLAPGLDSIAEIKVLTSNYQAEYGRSSGGTINVVTKSGTRRLRGGGFYAKRDDALNANEWQNNKFDRDKPPYKFDYSGYNVGGPIVLPQLQRRAQQALLLLEPGVPAAHQSGHADPSNHADRGRAARRFLTVHRHERPAPCRARSHQRPAVSGQRDPGQSHRSQRSGVAEPVPGAEFLRSHAPGELHVPELVRSAAQRSGAARRLERGAENALLLPSQLRVRSVSRAAGGSSSTMRTGHSCRSPTRSTATASSTRCCTRSVRRRSWK